MQMVRNECAMDVEVLFVEESEEVLRPRERSQ